MRLAILSVALVLFVICPSTAQTPVMVYGSGVDTCGKWNQQHTEASYGAIIEDAWLTGFVSGFNYFTNDPTGDIANGGDLAGMRGWVSNYCAANPLDTVSKAGTALISELRKRRGYR